MRTTVYTSGKELLAVAGDIFRQDEARYGLIYGIARLVVDNPHHYGAENPWFCTVENEGGLCAAAWRTLPYQPGLAWMGGDAAAAAGALVKAVGSRWNSIPGVTGHSEIVRPFAERWMAFSGTSVLHTIDMRIYRLDAVNGINPSPGRLRGATMADKRMLDRWIDAFNIDCFGESAAARPHLDLTGPIEQGHFNLWEDAGVPVSLCGKTRPTDTCMTIGPVYTPPDYRGRGYATTCVAAVCREVLQSGRKMCTLYADLANPYSNAAYIKVGFYPVFDSIDISFKVSR